MAATSLCCGWAMTPTAWLTSTSHPTAMPPSPAPDLIGGSLCLEPGRGGLSSLAFPQPHPDCRRSRPFPFVSLDFFLWGGGRAKELRHRSSK